MTTKTPKPPTPFLVQAARACALAPFLVAFVNVMVQSKLESAQASVIFTVIAGILLGAGMILGFVSLAGIKKHGVKRILLPTGIGLSVTAVLIAIAVPSFLKYQARARALAKQETAQAGQDVFLKYSGWMGFAQYQGATIGGVQVNTESQAHRMLNANLKKESEVFILTVNNPQGSPPMTVERSVNLVLGDEQIVRSIEIPQLTGFLLERADPALRDPAVTRTVAAGTELSEVLFFAGPVPWEQVKAMELAIGDQLVTIEGGVASVEKKQELFAAGLAAKEEAGRQAD